MTDLSNVKAIILSAADRIDALEAQIAGIREDITEIRGEVKGTGVTMKEFNAARRYRRLEMEKRQLALSGLRTCFEALDIGQQGELFPGGPAGNDDGGAGESDAWADLGGRPVSARGGEREAHRYPKNRFAGAPAAALADAFGDTNDAA